MNTKPIHIGIIGGMGPQASALLHTLIIKACTDKLKIKEVHDFPLITHISIPVVDFISDQSKLQENYNLVKSAVKTINSTPVDIAVIACNSAHLLIDQVSELANLPLISLPDSVAKEAHKSGAKKLGLLSTSVTVKSGLYKKYTDEYGIELITPDGKTLQKAEEVIRSTIAGKYGKKEVAEIRKMADNLKKLGAEKVALGCTELSVVMSEYEDEYLIDALTAASDIIIEQMRRLKKEYKK